MVNAILNRRGSAPPRPQRARAEPPLLDGVKRHGAQPGGAGARRLGLDLAVYGEVAYWVGQNPASGAREKRGDARERIRLRSAKVLDGAYRFLCECRILDRSLNGLRLLLGRNIRVPGQFAVHIDETNEVRRGRVVWRRGLMLGVRLYDHAPPEALRLSDRFALRERYYAIPD